MTHKESIHKLLNDAALEILAYIRENEPKFKDQEGWVPASEIKQALQLNFVSVPRSGKQYGEKGWVFPSLALMLEDKGLVEYRKTGSRAYYRSLR